MDPQKRSELLKFTRVSTVSLLHTSRRCLYWNQLFRPSPAFDWRREEIFLCREQKRLGHEASPLLGPPSGTNCLTIWRTLPWVYLFSNNDWNSICLNNVDLWYSLNWHVCQLMHLHSSVRSIASKKVTFILHYKLMRFQFLVENLKKYYRIYLLP